MSIVSAWSYGPYHVIESEGGLFSYDGLTYEGNQQPVAVIAAGSAIMAPFTAVGAGAVSVVGAGVAVMAPFRAYGINRGLVNANEGRGSAKMAAFRAAGSGSIVGGNIGYAVMKPFTAVGAGHVIHNIKGHGVATMAPFRGCTYVARGKAYMQPFRAVASGHVSRYSVDLNDLSRTPSTIITIRLDRCTRNFGESPCYGTGAPCYNTFATCKSLKAYNPQLHDHHFCLQTTPVKIDWRIIRPYLKDEKQAALEILTAENLIVNQRADLKFYDEPDDDIGMDPYRINDTTRQAIGGIETVAAAGTFWRKLLRRNRHYRGRPVIIRRGFDAPGNTLDDYQIEFSGILDAISISQDGTVSVTAKGLLALTDVEIPRKTDGKLLAPIGPSDDQVSLAPWTGLDMTSGDVTSKYSPAGLLGIDKEILRYASVIVDQTTGITTFTGIVRAQYNAYGWSTPIGHDKDAAVQQVAFFEGHPMDIMQQLMLLPDVGIQGTDIDASAFSTIKTDYLPGAWFAAVIATPVKVKTLLAELREQTSTHLWQNDQQTITARYLAPNYPWQQYRQITDMANIIQKSTHVGAGEDKRITRVSVFYDLMAGEKLEEQSFWRVTEYRDVDAEHAFAYDEIKARKPILSRWLWKIHGADDYASLLAGSIVTMFKDGAAQVTIDLEIKDSTLAIGEIFEIVSNRIVDVSGMPEARRYMITKRERLTRGKYRYTATETGIEGRYLFIAPDDVPDQWLDATPDQQGYGCISGDTGLAPDGGQGYKIT